MHRHARQARLAEVGPEGQVRIARASVAVRLEGASADVAVRYLAGAGVVRLCVRDASLEAVARAIDPSAQVSVDRAMTTDDADRALDVPFHDPAARDLGRGALLALRELRSAIDARAGGAS
ncbi:MAG: hypothetical protein FWD17_00830 [Polyangiaceae bacterium]|nr:hypothetical protein [Polyangiaceae bacterium]